MVRVGFAVGEVLGARNAASATQEELVPRRGKARGLCQTAGFSADRTTALISTGFGRDITCKRAHRLRLCHTRDMRWVVVLLALAPLCTPVASASPQPARAHLVVLERSPLTVRGTRFVAHEPVIVRVVLRGGPRVTKAVTAGAAGTWTVRFRKVSLGSCDSFFLRAEGARGSRAAYTEFPPPCGAAP
jgi:hypothetical protein